MSAFDLNDGQWQGYCRVGCTDIPFAGNFSAIEGLWFIHKDWREEVERLAQQYGGVEFLGDEDGDYACIRHTSTDRLHPIYARIDRPRIPPEVKIDRATINLLEMMRRMAPI